LEHREHDREGCLTNEQAVEKSPSAAFPSSFVVAAYIQCTPHSSGFRAPCIWAFLISLGKMSFSTGSEDVIPILFQKGAWG
jgi:hypothetical protein